MGYKLGSGTPTANTIDLVAYMFINDHGFTLQELSDRYHCSKQSILRYFRNINETCFGKVRRLDVRRDNESLYVLEINKELLAMLEKRIRCQNKRQEELKQSSEKSRKNKEVKGRCLEKKGSSPGFGGKKSPPSKSHSSKDHKAEKGKKLQKSGHTRKG